MDEDRSLPSVLSVLSVLSDLSDFSDLSLGESPLGDAYMSQTSNIVNKLVDTVGNRISLTEYPC